VSGTGEALPEILGDYAADLRAGRIGTRDAAVDVEAARPGGAGTGWAGGVEPAWAASGAMALTGHAGAAPLGLTVPFVARLDAALAVVQTLAADRGHPFASSAGTPPHPPTGAGQLLGERAAALGLTRGGVYSAGRAARLVRAADGWLAVNLARVDDIDLLPAWLERDDLAATDADLADDARPPAERGPHDEQNRDRAQNRGSTLGPDGEPPARARPWEELAAAVAVRTGTELAARADLLGLPVALLVDPATAATDAQATARGRRFPFAPFLVDGLAPDVPAGAAARPAGAAAGRRSGGPATPGRDLLDGDRRAPEDGGFTVVDLSSLWAGPLCAHLLGLAGGRVVKVEGVGRLDGARRGPAAFYDLLHAGHASVTVDLRTADGRAALVRLIERADVVLEASRPRALEQLGIEPAVMIARNPALTWVSITGYGRTGPWRQRPAFGDDAAVAAGAVAVDAAGRPVFLADAVADPVTGVLAAAAALGCLAAGGGRHVDIALREATGSLLAGRPVLPDHDPTLAGRGDDGHALAVAPPRVRAPAGAAAPAGHDNARLLPAPAGGEDEC
jgi:crotonobetainyl-CoA:carnitine CoA-transferase CaiB-like acyl-CoA transferase